MPPLRLSVVVPSTNGAPTLDRCVDAITATMQPGDELIVVDEPAGGAPAQRRNDGAWRARGDVLVFVDADVVLTRARSTSYAGRSPMTRCWTACSVATTTRRPIKGSCP